jgi:hypothetical protein
MGTVRALFNGLMKKHHRQGILLGQTTAATPEDFFGFDHSQVEAVHFHKHGVGPGVWFRLHCGRVVNEVAIPACRDPQLYDHARNWGTHA